MGPEGTALEIATTITKAAVAPAAETAMAVAKPAVATATEAAATVAETATVPLEAVTTVINDGAAIAQGVSQATAAEVTAEGVSGLGNVTQAAEASVPTSGVTSESLPDAGASQGSAGGEATALLEAPAEAASEPVELGGEQVAESVSSTGTGTAQGAETTSQSEGEVIQQTRDEIESYEWADAQLKQGADGIPNEIKEDPLYAGQYSDVSNESVNGEPKYPNPYSRAREALARYIRSKTLGEKDQNLTPEEKLDLALKQNKELRQQIKALTEAMKKLKEMMEELAQNQLEMTKDAEKKKSLMQMLFDLARISASSAFTGAKEAGALKVNGS